MSDLKIVEDPDAPDRVDETRSALPVPANDAALNRRDLDLIKRDLITVRKDYREIRDNMVVLTHQYSHAPSRSFFITFGVIWLVLLAGLLMLQPRLAALSNRFEAMVARQ